MMYLILYLPPCLMKSKTMFTELAKYEELKDRSGHFHGSKRTREQENILYHICSNHRKGCCNTRLKKYNVFTILEIEIQEYLDCAISQVEPVDKFGCKVTYGQKDGWWWEQQRSCEHLTLALEKEAQTSFLHLGNFS